MKDKEVEELQSDADQRRRDRKVISPLHQGCDWLHQKT